MQISSLKRLLLLVLQLSFPKELYESQGGTWPIRLIFFFSSPFFTLSSLLAALAWQTDLTILSEHYWIVVGENIFIFLYELTVG